MPAFVRSFGIRVRHCAERHPSGASGTDVETVPGSAHLKVRTHGMIMHVRKGGLRIEADCSTDGS
eukprot:2664376-Alexandrium_andersonii.AAC.1